MSLARKTVAGIVLAFSLVVLSSCGGSANNENGVVLTNLGFFLLEDEEEVTCQGELPTPVLGLSLPFGVIAPEVTGVFPAVPIVAVGYQNNTFQTVRIEATELSYFVPGASVQPPSTLVPSPIFLGPIPAGPIAGGQGQQQQQQQQQQPGAGNPTSLPEGFAQVCNRSFGQIQVIPSAVRAFISLNRASFPEAPFEMIVSARGSGITSAGDRIFTPEVSMGITITPETVINPGSNLGAGAGDGAGA